MLLQITAFSFCYLQGKGHVFTYWLLGKKGTEEAENMLTVVAKERQEKTEKGETQTVLTPR